MTKDVYKVRNCQHSYREKKRGKIQNEKITENVTDKAIIQCYSDIHVVNLVSTKALINITKDL